MSKLFRPARLWLSVVLLLGILASGSFDSALLSARASQKSSTSAKSKINTVEEGSRPRTVAASNEKRPNEPIVRIALMTDVTSISLSSDSGLVVSCSSPGARDDKIANGSLRVELREHSRKTASDGLVYRIAVESTDDTRRARKLAEELTKKFGEQAAVAYDSKEKEYDVVIGYRIDRAEGGLRRANAGAWNWLVRRLFGIPSRDVDCAFKMFDRRVFDVVHPQAEGAMISTEVLARAVRAGFRITEVGVHHYPRRHGTPTGANPLVIARAFYELFKLYRRITRDAR